MEGVAHPRLLRKQSLIEKPQGPSVKSRPADTKRKRLARVCGQR